MSVEWKNTDPRHALIDRKQARIVILRPHSRGWGWEVGSAFVQRRHGRHGWYVSPSFADRGRIGSDEAWDAAWLWTMEPEGP